MNAPLRVSLVRHGETEWSLSGRHTGRTDLPLTARGEQEAAALAPGFATTTFARVLCSPRLRARETCRLAGLGRDAVIDADLAEWDYGAYEGLRTAEIHAAHPGWDIWRDGCPGGESVDDASVRADRVIARAAPLPGAVALFSHGQFGRVLAARWIGLPAVQGRHFAIDTASVGILGFEADHPQRRVIAQWNARPVPAT